MKTTEVIIYGRFSTLEQSKGHSAERQAENCANMCTTFGWRVSPELTFLEKGKSAFSGANRAKGSILATIEAEIAADAHVGRIFVVEHLDRISRQGWQEVCGFLDTCTTHGVTVATVDGGRLYRPGERIDLGAVIEIVVKAELARAESVNKSGRVSKSFASKREAAANNGAKAIATRPPAWIERVGDGFAVHAAKASLVREVFQLCADGHGTPEIEHRFNERGVRTWTGKGKWHSAYISRILSSRETIGEYHSPKHGVRIVDYYPSVVTVDLFSRAQASRNTRKQKPVGRRGACQTSLFTGLTICAECGSKMYLAASRVKGRPVKRFRRGKPVTDAPSSEDASYLICSAARGRVRDPAGNPVCTNRRGIRYERLEPVILDQVLTIALSKERFNVAELSKTRIAVAELERQIDVKTERMAKLAANLEEEVSPTLMRQLVQIEKELPAMNAELSQLRTKLAGEGGPSPEMLARIAHTRASLSADDLQVRRDARVLVSDAMKSVVTSIQCDAAGVSTVAIAAGLAGFQIDHAGKLIAAYDASGDPRIVHVHTTGEEMGRFAPIVGEIRSRARIAGRA